MIFCGLCYGMFLIELESVNLDLSVYNVLFCFVVKMFFLIWLVICCHVLLEVSGLLCLAPFLGFLRYFYLTIKLFPLLPPNKQIPSTRVHSFIFFSPGLEVSSFLLLPLTFPFLCSSSSPERFLPLWYLTRKLSNTRSNCSWDISARLVSCIWTSGDQMSTVQFPLRAAPLPPPLSVVTPCISGRARSQWSVERESWWRWRCWAAV